MILNKIILLCAQDILTFINYFFYVHTHTYGLYLHFTYTWYYVKTFQVHIVNADLDNVEV